jgi:hypothetical protein
MSISAQSKSQLMQFQKGRSREVRPVKQPKELAQRPTSERMGDHETIAHYRAIRIVPVIDTLLKKGKINYSEHEALERYCALRAQSDRSPIMDSITRLGHISGASGDGPTLRRLCTTDTVDYMRRELGSLLPLIDAIAYESISLTEWLTRQGKTRIKCDTKRGEKKCAPYADKKYLDIALMELKLGARRIQSY